MIFEVKKEDYDYMLQCVYQCNHKKIGRYGYMLLENEKPNNHNYSVNGIGITVEQSQFSQSEVEKSRVAALKSFKRLRKLNVDLKELETLYIKSNSYKMWTFEELARGFKELLKEE